MTEGTPFEPEKLQAIFAEALGGRAAVPSIEVCRALAPSLAGLRKTGAGFGGELLSDKVRKASVALRNKLPEAESYWRGDAARARDPMKVDCAVRKLAALRAALDDCDNVLRLGDDVLGPVPMPYKQRWDEFAVLVLDVFDRGMAGIEHDSGLWEGSPRVVFLHRVAAVLGWRTVSVAAVFKHLVRERAAARKHPEVRTK